MSNTPTPAAFLNLTAIRSAGDGEVTLLDDG